LKFFYLSPDKWKEPFVLEGPEAHHLLTVLRILPGEQVRLFDGAGRVGTFMLQHRERHKAHFAVLSQQTLPRPEQQIFLALGWNKTSRRGWLLEKAVELQAAGLVFWQADRSQGHIPAAPKDVWQTQLFSAAKQCGNPWVPSLSIVSGGASDLVRLFQPFIQKFLLWERESLDSIFDPACLSPQGRCIFVIGPEGGLTAGEVDVFKQAGYAPLSLGRLTLRWETAALLCLGLCCWHDQKKSQQK
jgi:16S rRNA (uracil1498-N3)-methyltransferase